jgi:hypothetical protein
VQAISATRGSGAAPEPGAPHRAGFFGAVTGVDVICRLRAEKAFKRLAVLTREATAGAARKRSSRSSGHVNVKVV